MRRGLTLGLCAVALLATTNAIAQGGERCTAGPGPLGATQCAEGSGASAREHAAKRKLAVKVRRSSRFADDYPKRVTVFVSARKDGRLRKLRAKLVGADGQVVASGRARGGRGPVPVELDVTSGLLQPGQYVLQLSGRQAGKAGHREANRSLGFASRTEDPPGPLYPDLAPLPEPGPGVSVQQATVDWRAGEHRGNDQAGFDAPGIGHGTLTCRPNTQWVRFFPDSRKRETTMMNWTFKDWETWREHALREAVAREGNDFNEGLNKFGSIENVSRGYFVGIITDRLGLSEPGGPSLAPTTLRLTWDWDFSDPANAHCFASVALVSEKPPDQGPVSSLTVNWRGAENAIGRELATATVPGVGEVELRCEPGPGGDRWLRITPAPDVVHADFQVFEASEMAATSQAAAPYLLRLPNNGMVSASLGTAGTMLISSRFKVNDPDAHENFCHLAAQVIAG